MSRRRLEQGASGASNFSLRALPHGVSPPTAAAVNVPQQRMSPPPVSGASQLSFKFNSICVRPSQPVTMAAAEHVRMAAPVMPQNVPSIQSVQKNEGLRLQAIVNDLSDRLKKANDVKAQLETQLHRVGAAFAQERSNSASRLHTLKSEVAAVKASEERLRSELLSRPVVKEVDNEKFSKCVKSALAAEEVSARVADAEARLHAVVKKHDALTAEVALLDEKRAIGVAAQSSMLTVDEVDDLLKRAAISKSELIALEEKQDTVKDSIVHLEAVRSSHHDDIKQCEADLAKANEDTASAVADAKAAKQQVQELLLEHGSVAGKLTAMRQKLSECATQAAVPSFTVTGTAPVKAKLGVLEASPAQQVDVLSCCHTGLPPHFDHDSPAGLTIGAHPKSEKANALVEAIVTDLKSYLTDAQARHANLATTGAAAA